ncbi:Prp19/Pso4-like-domain-containing protein [Histomonas meleagridis]|uniref:Prp19/Pso4-like-domain-containing protein n=1 Tax=Histomonas meleagridis TaxID=135588 RepID=UPI00355A046B|nr:Prp19/Pso4-like-domain-containing protein [Histomonas meleagridis]KAH0805337.1 Prp19/Pso4-like-domain-containing protein [Histomonas meleagridis]
MIRCRLTGQIVQHPVITPCRHIFERSAIESHLNSSSFCPVCNQNLSLESLEDLEYIPIEATPATLREASFPSIMSSVQNEWNAIQEELHDLREKLATTQKELALTLYENDAAKRVIARLLAERGEIPDQ